MVPDGDNVLEMMKYIPLMFLILFCAIPLIAVYRNILIVAKPRKIRDATCGCGIPGHAVEIYYCDNQGRYVSDHEVLIRIYCDECAERVAKDMETNRHKFNETHNWTDAKWAKAVGVKINKIRS